MRFILWNIFRPMQRKGQIWIQTTPCSIHWCMYERHWWSLNARSRWERTAMCVRLAHYIWACLWVGIMELELHAFLYCVKHMAPYLLERRFTVRIDNKNLVFLSNSTTPACLAIGVPGWSGAYPRTMQSGDWWTHPRVSRLEYEIIKPTGLYLYEDDTINRIFRLEGEEIESRCNRWNRHQNIKIRHVWYW